MSYMLVGGGERVEHAKACGPPRSTYAPHACTQDLSHDGESQGSEPK